MRVFVFAILFGIGMLSFFMPSNVSALGLKVAPLEYKTTIRASEVKQGFVDVSNPSSLAVTVKVNVQAFKQIDDDGGLQFYDDTQIQSGITPEMSDIELGPREAVRLFFTISGDKLPEGDVFAALFFTTDPKQAQSGVGQQVRVGTLLSLINKTPGDRSAEITKLNIPFFQLSSTVSGAYSVKNTASGTTGFYPTVKVSSWPAKTPKDVQSSLVFGGRERSNDFTYATGFGIHRLDVSYGDNKKSQWVVTIAPWMIILSLLIILIVGIELLLLKKRRKNRLKKTPKNHTATSDV